MCSHIVQCMVKMNPALTDSMVNGLMPVQRWRHWTFWQPKHPPLSHPVVRLSLYFKTLKQILTTNYIINTFSYWKWMFFKLILPFIYFWIHLSSLYEKASCVWLYAFSELWQMLWKREASENNEQILISCPESKNLVAGCCSAFGAAWALLFPKAFLLIEIRCFSEWNLDQK